ncbi:MAG: hypothetical protein WB987_01220 [Candidatus Acidiferrales bacterium]
MRKDGNFMDCVRFEEVVHELDRPGSRGAKLREAALVHAEICGRCAALLTETESLDFALVKIADEAERNVVPSRVEVALLQEFRRAKTRAARRRMQWQVAVIGVAAAVFLAMGLSLRHRAVTSSGIEAGSQAKLSVPKPGADSTDIGTRQKDGGNTQGVTDSSVVLADDTDENQLAQDFTLLPYADDPSMMEGGTVVRVLLSRSTLASFGVPVTDVAGTEQIPADLVVSADGTPEAIRLISQNMD